MELTNQKKSLLGYLSFLGLISNDAIPSLIGDHLMPNAKLNLMTAIGAKHGIVPTFRANIAVDTVLALHKLPPFFNGLVLRKHTISHLQKKKLSFPREVSYKKQPTRKQSGYSVDYFLKFNK